MPSCPSSRLVLTPVGVHEDDVDLGHGWLLALEEWESNPAIVSTACQNTANG